MELYLFDMTKPSFIEELGILSGQNKERRISKSYSKEIMAVCISDKRTMGIDLEKRVKRSPKTIKHFMDKFTTFQIKDKPVEADEEWFYKAWTAMESYFKLKGEGFSTPKDFVLDIDGKCVWQKDKKVAWFEYFEFHDYICCLCSDEYFIKKDVSVSLVK